MATNKIKPTGLPASTGEIIQDYRLASMSRQGRLISRREVMSGKAKFGIFGAGKELAQIAIWCDPKTGCCD